MREHRHFGEHLALEGGANGQGVGTEAREETIVVAAAVTDAAAATVEGHARHEDDVDLPRFDAPLEAGR